MNRRQVIFEHREALSKYDEVVSEWRGCTVKNKCLGKECITCPAAATKREAKQTLEEKAKALEYFNNLAIQRNSEEVILNIQKREKRMEERNMAHTAKLTIERYRELVLKGLKATEIANEVGIATAAVYNYKSQWKKQGLLDDMGEKKKGVVEKKKEVVAEAKAIVAEPVAEPIIEPTVKVEPKEGDTSYKILAQQYRDDLEKMGAELAREKERTKMAVTELHEVQRQRIQLHNETTELAEELANASYEYAELKREFNALVMIAKPLVVQYADALAVKE